MVIIRSWDKYIALPVFRKKRRACKNQKMVFARLFVCDDESENSLSLSEKSEYSLRKGENSPNTIEKK